MRTAPGLPAHPAADGPARAAGFGNNWLVLLKTTALLSVLGLDDVLRKASLAAGATRQPFTFYITAGIVYLLADHGLGDRLPLSRAALRRRL
ncbi:MAG: hypothetical protein U1E17_01585 [Geminicoccaceae bacterium]